MHQEILKRLEGARFRRVAHGYDPAEVDSMLSEASRVGSALIQENRQLRAEVQQFLEQRKLIGQTLVLAEQAAAAREAQARELAAAIEDQARQRAEALISTGEARARQVNSEVEAARRELRRLMFSYQREALDQFYVLARKHIDTFRSEFLFHMAKNTVGEIDEEFDSLGIASGQQGAGVRPVLEAGESVLLLGRVLQHDVTDDGGRVLVPSETIVTPELLEEAICKGFYGDLVAALDAEKSA